MGVVLAVFSFLFLLAGVTTQIVSYLTSYMYENTLIARDHNGLFYRCGDLYGVIIGCYWWNRDIFNKDPRWLQAVMILSIVCGGITFLTVLFGLVTLIPRYTTRRLRVFVGVLAMFNALLIAAIVTVYTILNDRSIKFSGGTTNYSWSYWLLYGSIGSYLLSSIFFCCDQPRVSRDF